MALPAGVVVSRMMERDVAGEEARSEAETWLRKTVGEFVAAVEEG
jgi:hypothetical protein